jgi:glycosyltransferase involved in cell wall biosynthesis
MKISLITPTGGRKIAFALCEEWMKRQTLQPDEWIVVDDFEKPTKCKMGQKVIRRQPFWQPGQMTLQRNLLEALKVVTGDIILIVEDDDWYSPNYIENMAKKFETLSQGTPISNSSFIIGEGHTVYYQIRNYTHKYHDNLSHSSLFQTGFTKDLIPKINDLLIKHIDQMYFDMHLWKDIKDCNKCIFLTKSPWSIGIKALVGQRSVGTYGHFQSLPHLDEKYCNFLQKMMPKEDAHIYMRLSEFLNIKEFDRVDKIYQSKIAELDENLRNLDFNQCKVSCTL